MKNLRDIFDEKYKLEKIPFPQTYYDKLNKILRDVGFEASIKGNLNRDYSDIKTGIRIYIRFVGVTYQTVNEKSRMSVTISYPLFTEDGSSLGQGKEELGFVNVVENFEQIMEEIDQTIKQIPTF